MQKKNHMCYEIRRTTRGAFSHLSRGKHMLTVLRSREEAAFSCCPTQSLEGTTSFFNRRFQWNVEISTRFRSFWCSNSDTSKCTEQSTDVFDVCHFALCLWTKRTHFSWIVSSCGNICIDMPSVFQLLVPLTFPGPPATQYLPNECFFGLLGSRRQLQAAKKTLFTIRKREKCSNCW